jgi:hypothetical protein
MEQSVAGFIKDRYEGELDQEIDAVGQYVEDGYE